MKLKLKQKLRQKQNLKNPKIRVEFPLLLAQIWVSK